MAKLSSDLAFHPNYCRSFFPRSGENVQCSLTTNLPVNALGRMLINVNILVHLHQWAPIGPWLACDPFLISSLRFGVSFQNWLFFTGIKNVFQKFSRGGQYIQDFHYLANILLRACMQLNRVFCALHAVYKQRKLKIHRLMLIADKLE